MTINTGSQPNLLDGTRIFMERSGQLYDNGSSGNEREFSQERLGWFLEEFKEYMEAVACRDETEQLDGALDMIVILWGTILDQFGQTIVQKAADEVTRSNLSKVGENMVYYPGTNKVGKPEGFIPARIGQILEEARYWGP